MNRKTRFLHRFAADENGVAAIEMALTFPIIVWLTMAILELGIIFHISSLANFAANEASRMGKTGNNYGMQGSREQLTYNTIRRYLEPWMINSATLQVDSQAYGSFRDLGQAGRSGSVGGANEIVIYTATLQWSYLTPLFATITRQPTLPITARVLTKNENF